MNSQDTLRITQEGTCYFNMSKVENCVWKINPSDGNLYVTGDFIINDTTLDYMITDEKELDLIEDIFIKTYKTFFKRKIYRAVPEYTRYIYKKREFRQIITSHFFVRNEQLS